MDPGSPVQGAVYVIEDHSAIWTLPSTARWVGAGDLAMADYEQQAESSEFEQEDLRSSEGTVAICSQLEARQIAGPH
jgi:hypothetical protein